MEEKENLVSRFKILKKRLSPENLQKEIEEIQTLSCQPGFWQDQEKAARLMKKMARLNGDLETLDWLEKNLNQENLDEVAKKLAAIELRIFFSGRYDSAPALLSIHAGQGGTEAMDWAQMLERMYLHYFEKKGWAYSLIEENPGDEAGIKNVTFSIDEEFAYGHLKFEAGTHRLVRQSPFNADQLRQTSFALVEVLPQIEDSDEIEIKEDDLEWQFYRSSGHGGQNVQKVSTAARLTHKPTGLVITCQTERYQEQNRKIALQLLRAKLWQQQEAERQKQLVKIKGGRTKAAWGTQIRSYVLHPYKLVKDLRTQVETASAETVLAGDLDKFIQAEIRLLSELG